MGVPKIGFITVKGKLLLSAPCRSVKVTAKTCPSVKKLELTVTVKCVVSTKVAAPTGAPSKKTWVLALKFRPKMSTGNVAAPTFTAPGVTELREAIDGGASSVSWILHMLRP